MMDLEKAERLAENLARGKGRPQWVVRSMAGQIKVVNKPLLANGLAIESLKAWLPSIGITFESEFDATGKRVS